MVRRLKAILMVAVLLCMSIAIPAFADDIVFNAEVKVNYDDSKISFTVESPAKYRQIISVRMYVGEPETLVRAMEVTADARGNAAGTFIMDISETNADISGYYTLKFQGGGYLADSSKDEVTVFYEKNSELYEETLPRFNAATVDTIGDLLIEKRDMLTYDFGEYYEENSELLHEIFINTRLVDFSDEYTRFTQVQDTMDTITLISTVKQATSADAARRVCERNKELLEIDTNHAHYKNNEEAVYTILRNLIDEKTPLSLKELKKYIRQSIAIAELNRSNSAEITDVITTYSEELGIDIADYNSLCSLHGAMNFNKPFVEANYKTVTAFKNAYINRKNTIKKSDSSGGGGGGGGGGGAANDTPSSKEDVKNPITNIETGGTTQPAVIHKEFSDVNNSHWAYQSVVALSELDVVAGFEDGSFRPDENVTREQFIKMLVEAFELYDKNATCSFNDVKKGAWYYSYVASAFNANITKGQGSVFGTGKSITREDAAVMMHRIMVPDFAGEFTAKTAFADDADMAEYSKASVYQLVDMGIISGMGNNNFAPKANLTRAQAAKIIYGSLSYSYIN